MTPPLDLRVATLNVSGGEKSFEELSSDCEHARLEALRLLITRLDADLLCLQEMSQYLDADGVSHSLMEHVDQAGRYDASFYAKTVSMETHLQVRKDIMVEGIFNDWWNWSKGNAIHARYPFVRLGDPERPGIPRNIPLYEPAVYHGNRDSEPRFALLTRLGVPPHPFVATLHLTTLMGERKVKAKRHTIKKSHLIRQEQLTQFLDLVRVHILEKDEPLILAGDFNAVSSEYGISHLLESTAGFVRLVPENDGPTHPLVDEAIDHIFFYPKERLLAYSCRIDTSDLSRRASDHLPVVADLQIQ